MVIILGNPEKIWFRRGDVHNFVVKKGYISPASVREVSNRFYKDSSAILVGAPQLAPGCTSDNVGCLAVLVNKYSWGTIERLGLETSAPVADLLASHPQRPRGQIIGQEEVRRVKAVGTKVYLFTVPPDPTISWSDYACVADEFDRRIRNWALRIQAVDITWEK